MNTKIQTLISNAQFNEDDKVIMAALTNLGLLVERHTQNRYNDLSYLSLLGNDDELFELKLSDNDVNSIAHFLFYHIMNTGVHPVTVAWCLGKCYGLDIYQGIIGLLKLFSHDDDICEQLLFSLNALYDPRETFRDIAKILENPVKGVPLPKTNRILMENFELLNHDED